MKSWGGCPMFRVELDAKGAVVCTVLSGVRSAVAVTGITFHGFSGSTCSLSV